MSDKHTYQPTRQDEQDYEQAILNKTDDELIAELKRIALLGVPTAMFNLPPSRRPLALTDPVGAPLTAADFCAGRHLLRIGERGRDPDAL